MIKPRKFPISSASVLLLGVLSISGGSVISLPSTVAQELTANSRFYFEADGITEQKILEVSGLDDYMPSRRGFSPVLLKVVETNRALANWAMQSTQRNPRNWAQDSRRSCSVSVYSAAGSLQARWEMSNCFIYHYLGPTLRQGNVTPATIEIHHEGIKRMQ